MIEAVVTGANGWLGKALVFALINGIESLGELPVLDKNNRLRVLILPGDSVESLASLGDRIDIVRGDICNISDCENLLKDCENAILYHTVGVIHPKKASEFYSVNLEGTKNVLLTAEKNKIKRAVVVSSNSPIGCNPSPDHLFDESSLYNPYMGYGHSKMLMELFVKEVQKRGVLETVIIRAPWFYGLFQPPRQTLFFQMIKDGKCPIIGDGKNMRSMVYVENLAQGLILAGHQSIANGKIYWIADERPYSMNAIVDTIENVMEKDFNIPCAHKRMKLPSFVSDIAYAVDCVLQRLGLYQQKIHVLSEMNKSIACSVALAKKELGYAPTVALREGMRRSIQSMLDNGIKI